MINGQIRDKEVRVIGENGEQIGIMSPREAMKIAQEAELDLVKIAPKAQPPVPPSAARPRKQTAIALLPDTPAA